MKIIPLIDPGKLSDILTDPDKLEKHLEASEDIPLPYYSVDAHLGDVSLDADTTTPELIVAATDELERNIRLMNKLGEKHQLLVTIRGDRYETHFPMAFEEGALENPREAAANAMKTAAYVFSQHLIQEPEENYKILRLTPLLEDEEEVHYYVENYLAKN
ncbi:MAG: hypothetical protein GOV15_04015 [Candidatus Diapherotrites archaeon]|nr:hypothetical protein [Candidatus Diapherotrites archaeon]